MKKFPKSITNHPGVQQVFDGPSEGFADYKYHVWLYDSWMWGDRGFRNYGGISGNFNTVDEFLTAHPIKKVT